MDLQAKADRMKAFFDFSTQEMEELINSLRNQYDSPYYGLDQLAYVAAHLIVTFGSLDNVRDWVETGSASVNAAYFNHFIPKTIILRGELEKITLALTAFHEGVFI